MSQSSRHPRVGLLTFGGGLGSWRGAARRLADQATKSGWFTQTAAVTDSDLRADHPFFAQTHASVLNRRTRGFGYWIWKPYLIHHFIEFWKSSVDLLLYLDAGHEINASPVAGRRFLDYCSLALDGDRRLVMHLPAHSDAMWSKGDVHRLFNLSAQEVHSPQIQASPFFVAPDVHNSGFVQEWLSACVFEDYRLVDDSASTSPNAEGFVGHRHDQAIFSALAKSEGVDSIPDETYWSPNWEDTGENFPLWAVRNRSRVSIREQSRLALMVRKRERLSSRLIEEVTWRRAKQAGK